MTHDARLFELLDAMCEGTLSAADNAELEDRVTSEPQTMELYLQYVQLHGTLHWDNASPATSSVAATHQRATPPLPVRPAPWWRRLIDRANQQPVAAALFALVVVSAIVLTTALLRPPAQQIARPILPEIDARQAPRTVAQVVSTHQCKWGEMSQIVGERSYLLVGQLLRVERGLVEIEFKPGTRMILRGPAELRLETASQVRLNRGRLTARVPSKAVGFTVHTPTSTVVDLGTQFGVRVTPRGDSLVRVFSGEVETTATETGEILRLLAGQSARFTHAKPALVDDEAEDSEFVLEMPKRAQPELVGFYPFEGDGRDASGQNHHATAIQGIKFVAGREGQAAQFAGTTTSYIDLPIDARQATLPRLTWGAWVRPQAIGNTHREILSTDNGGFDRTLTIDDRSGPAGSAGQPRFAAFCGSRGVAASRIGPRVGQWTFVAAVYDGPAHRSVLYVSDPTTERLSAIAATTAITSSLPFIRVGMHAGGTDEPFRGEIDNVFIFRGVLTLQQIEAIYRGGEETLRSMNLHENPGDASTENT